MRTCVRMVGETWARKQAVEGAGCVCGGGERRGRGADKTRAGEEGGSGVGLADIGVNTGQAFSGIGGADIVGGEEDCLHRCLFGDMHALIVRVQYYS